MYAYLAVAAVCLLVGFGGGWKTQSWRYDAAELERTRIESRDRVKKIERGDDAAVAHEDTKAKEEVRYVTVIKKVDRIVGRPVYARTCFDDDGLRVLNAAISGSESAGEPPAKMPGPATPAR